VESLIDAYLAPNLKLNADFKALNQHWTSRLVFARPRLPEHQAKTLFQTTFSS